MRTFLFLIISSLLAQTAYGQKIKVEIASIDNVMIRACQLAEVNAATSSKDKTKSFLNALTDLENQYRKAGNRDGLLACRKVRGKYDPKAPKINQPTKLFKELNVLVFWLEKQLSVIERHKSKTIVDAKHGRARKLTALMRGLVQRGDKAGRDLVVAALKSEPSVPKVDPKTIVRKTITPKSFTLLTYNRTRKRWVKMDDKDDKGVERKVARDGTTTLHYSQGNHWLLKVHWPEVLQVGDRFSVEVKGAHSVELIDLDGADANARFDLPESRKYIKVEIVREQNQISFTCDGLPKKTFYATGKLRGKEAQTALLKTSLRAAFSVKKDAKASFRNAKLIRQK